MQIKMLQFRLLIYCGLVTITLASDLRSDGYKDVMKPYGAKTYNKPISRKAKLDDKLAIINHNLMNWHCPNISQTVNLECSCDLPHTLRCSGDFNSLQIIADGLRNTEYGVSLLDCTLRNVTFLSDPNIFENVSLHGLVISSGEIKRIHRFAFQGLQTPLQALGLPNNALFSVPWMAFGSLKSLERLDLSNNKIKSLGVSDFLSLQNLSYLELSENQISNIADKTFTPLKKLTTLKLNSNRIGDFPLLNLHMIKECINLRDLSLKSNSIRGPLTDYMFPPMKMLESLNLDRNLITRIDSGALEGFPNLVTLSLRQNQIDVLEDHSFSGLNSLQSLDLGHNGIVAISGASLQHLPRLIVLDLTHNYLRALTSDMTRPLVSLKELRLDGNDITIIERDALTSAAKLNSLSLQDNPLACDCGIKPFTDWLAQSNISTQDLSGASCATPPQLEGASLLDISLESLNCSPINYSTDDNSIKQIRAIKQNNSNEQVLDYGKKIRLQSIHISDDYGLILTWTIDLSKDEFTCDAIFIYKEIGIAEQMIAEESVHCESSMIQDKNVVSIILPKHISLSVGQRYRFCLALYRDQEHKSTLAVGCSNMTQILTNPDDSMLNVESDISSFEKISDKSREFGTHVIDLNITESTLSDGMIGANGIGGVGGGIAAVNGIKKVDKMSISRTYLPALGLCVLIIAILIIGWTIVQLGKKPKTQQDSCYTVSSDGQMTSYEMDKNNTNRYLKLQATTSV